MTLVSFRFMCKGLAVALEIRGDVLDLPNDNLPQKTQVFISRLLLLLRKDHEF